MPISKRRILSGSPALDNERAIAEAIINRTAGLRSSLATLGKEHNAFMAKCDGEVKKVMAEIERITATRDELKINLADMRSAYYNVKRVWLQGKKDNEKLQKELAESLRRSKMLEEARQNSAESAAKLELGLKTKVKAKEDGVAAREVAVSVRELNAAKVEKRNTAEDKRIREAAKMLSDKEREYAVRINTLVVREQKAEAVLAKEVKLQQEEGRIDLKAKIVQDKDKALQIERIEIARKRAYLRKKERGTK